MGAPPGQRISRKHLEHSDWLTDWEIKTRLFLQSGGRSSVQRSAGVFLLFLNPPWFDLSVSPGDGEERRREGGKVVVCKAGDSMTA